VQHLLVSQEYSNETARAYSGDLAQFAAWLERTSPRTSPKRISSPLIQRYAEALARLKPATIRRKLSALSAFFDWLVCRGEVRANPVAAVKRPRRRERETKWVTAEDSVALLAACRDDRERAIFVTYLRAGLRYSELMTLRLVDVDLGRNELSVVGKGRLRRGCPILSDLRPYLVRWLAVRPRRAHDFLFTTRTGGPLYEKACWRLFRKLLKRAGLERKGYTVHSLRHGAATQMYEAGVDLGTIARFLRHSDMSTVNRYVHAATDVVRREVEAKLNGTGLSLPGPGCPTSPETLESVVREAVAEALARLCVPPRP
jgi:site-specific recombinase XerD